MRIDIKKIGQGILAVLKVAVKIFSIYKLFTKGGNCDRENDGHKNEGHHEKDRGEEQTKKEREKT